MRSHFILFLLVTTLVACQERKSGTISGTNPDSLHNKKQEPAVELAGSFSPQVLLKFDSLQLQPFFIQYPLFSSVKNNVYKFYEGRKFAFAWFDANGQIEQAGHLYNRVENLPEEGIITKVPYRAVLDSLMGTIHAAEKSERIKTELMLTAFYFYYAERVWGGIDEEKTKKMDWYLPRKKLSYEAWLDSLLRSPEGLHTRINPLYRQYYLLKNFLTQYKEIEKRSPWKIIKTDKRSYALHDSSAVIIDIRKRLFSSGDLDGGDTTSAEFDEDLATAVINFQQRHGLKKDGVIGPTLINEMNVSIHKRIEQIIINMERNRWLPVNVEGDYLAVNIPEFKLHAYKGDSLIWNMDVVVGQSMNKTVIFSGDLKYVVFSPYWNVPASILKKEVLPGIRRNKNYLSAHHMEWNGNSVRQIPGPWNSLGAVKFLFPNSFSIYLHDTPAKGLFSEDNRAFSHGCIRVAEPKKLAQYLLRYDTAWTEARITQAMSGGKEQYITLKKTVPVFITYFTAWVDRQGKLNFRSDVYDRDGRLAEMIINE